MWETKYIGVAGRPCGIVGPILDTEEQVNEYLNKCTPEQFMYGFWFEEFNREEIILWLTSPDHIKRELAEKALI